MLGKLIKNEFRAVNRLLIPIHLILVAVTILGRFYVQFVLTNQHIPFARSNFSALEVWGILLNSMLVVVYVVALIAVNIITSLYLRILRFRKNLFTDEGYLMHTLPVSPAAHIWSKTIVTFLWSLIDGLLIALSVFIMVTNKEIQEGIGKLWSEMCKSFPEAFGVSAGIGIPLFLLVGLISSLCGILVIYACITVGHSFNSHKILASIGIYAGYVTVNNLLSSLFTALSELIAGNPGLGLGTNPIFFSFNAAASGTFSHPTAYFWATFCFTTMLSLVTGVAAYFLSHYFMTKRLNLE